jgi:hypothetical protein
MTARDFCFWLQGYFEVAHLHTPRSAEVGLSTEQVRCIERHLALVFKHDIDPSQGDAAHQQELQQIHGGDFTARC